MEVLINDELFLFKDLNMGNNSYVIINNKSAIVIDPSWSSEAILSFLIEKKISKVYVFITHAHYDHIAGIGIILSKYYNAKFFISSHEANFIIKGTSKSVFKTPVTVSKENVVEIINKKAKYVIDGIVINTFYNPGHSHGSTSFIYKNYIFTGDFIFSNCVGRVDLPTGNLLEMKKSINEFLKIVKEENVICPGHDETSIFRVVKIYNDEMNELIDVKNEK